MSDFDEIKRLALAATPQDFDSAEIIDKADDLSFASCPLCDGEGAVEIVADYCNYDEVALGVQFYGVGSEHIDAEAYYRAIRPSVAIELVDEITQLRAELTEHKINTRQWQRMHAYELRRRVESEKELADVQQDARRYRWLSFYVRHPEEFQDYDELLVVESHQEFGAAVDKAMGPG